MLQSNFKFTFGVILVFIYLGLCASATDFSVLQQELPDLRRHEGLSRRTIQLACGPKGLIVTAAEKQKIVGMKYDRKLNLKGKK